MLHCSCSPKLVWTWCAFHILTLTCAWRHNGVHFSDNFKKWGETLSFQQVWLWQVFGGATTTCTFSTPYLRKVVWDRQFLAFFGCECACHNGVHFFKGANVSCPLHLSAHSCSISTSKSAPNLRCFEHFDAETFSAATPYTCFSTSQFPKMVWQWCPFTILPSTCASRHNGMHFVHISTSKSALRLVCL